jgi:hypothetical protein
MKFSQTILLGLVAAQESDRWGGTDYYSFNYGFGGKQDAGLAFGQDAGSTYNPALQLADNYLGDTNGMTTPLGSGHHDNLHFNGLLCWMCDTRLDLGTQAETTEFNAYYQCLKNGMLMRCRGEQRTCMFEERRRHGVVYSVCTGCKQTDACVAHWRRNQRFTLPFMNFGDMSIRNLPNPITGRSETQLPNHRPMYIDDECSTYQETRDETTWRTAVDDNDVTADGTGGTQQATADDDTHGGVSVQFPMGYDGTTGKALFNGGTSYTTNNKFSLTGWRNNIGLSYSKFAYDTGTGQANAQLSQWESTCRWCCAAKPDTVCNIEMKDINSSPFSTKCGDSTGATRHEAHASGAIHSSQSIDIHPVQVALNTLNSATTTGSLSGSASDSDATNNYWYAASQITGTINGIAAADALCSLSNDVWATASGTDTNASPAQFIAGTFRFFQPFHIAMPNALIITGGTEYASQGPRYFMQEFQREPMYDLSKFATNAADGWFVAKFPAVGEGRNSAGMDKYAGRGNQNAIADTHTGTKIHRHYFEHQTDMVSQENRDFFDARRKDAKEVLQNPNQDVAK